MDGASLFHAMVIYTYVFAHQTARVVMGTVVQCNITSLLTGGIYQKENY